MAKRGKRYNEISQKVDKLKIYTPEEALDLLFETKSAKFVETVELAVKLGVDPRHADQQVRGTVVLPNGTGKKIKILAITSGENIEKALQAGATYAGDDEYIAKIQQGWFDFDLVIATPDMMPKLGRYLLLQVEKILKKLFKLVQHMLVMMNILRKFNKDGLILT